MSPQSRSDHRFAQQAWALARQAEAFPQQTEARQIQARDRTTSAGAWRRQTPTPVRQDLMMAAVTWSGDPEAGGNDELPPGWTVDSRKGALAPDSCPEVYGYYDFE